MILSDVAHAEPADFRRLTVDLYVPPAATGYWQGAIRRPTIRSGTTSCDAWTSGHP